MRSASVSEFEPLCLVANTMSGCPVSAYAIRNAAKLVEPVAPCVQRIPP